MEESVTNSQIDDLLDFLTIHSNLAKGLTGARSKGADKLWDELAVKLNAHKYGCRKTAQRWKRFWISLKHKARARAANTDDLSNNSADNSEIDKRILDIIGETNKKNIEDKLDTKDEENQSEVTQPTSPASSINSEKSEDISSETPRTNSPEPLTQVDTTFIIKLEKRRLAAEEKHAEAAMSMAEASKIMAEASKLMADAAMINAKSAQKQILYPSWIKELELRRVEAEEKHAEAAKAMAEASRIIAEATTIMAAADMVNAKTARIQALASTEMLNLLKHKL